MPKIHHLSTEGEYKDRSTVRDSSRQSIRSRRESDIVSSEFSINSPPASGPEISIKYSLGSSQDNQLDNNVNSSGENNLVQTQGRYKTSQGQRSIGERQDQFEGNTTEEEESDVQDDDDQGFIVNGRRLLKPKRIAASICSRNELLDNRHMSVDQSQFNSIFHPQFDQMSSQDAYDENNTRI